MRSEKRDRLETLLRTYAGQCRVTGKGPLSVVLVITRNAKSRRPPFRPSEFLTPQGGQVAGLGRAAVQAILRDHEITRVLAEEGGRTSRGSINRMREYLDFLNKLAEEGCLNLDKIESWWIERIREHFAAMPLKLKVDASKSLRSIVGGLIEAAFSRQEECPGMMVAGAVMQHLVGAKLAIAAPNVQLEHHGFSVADTPSSRQGDFLIHDTAIHVTTAPTEALIRKCLRNLDMNVRPVIVTTERGAGGAHALAKNAEVEDRIDILEIEQFVATNVYEWCGFEQNRRPVSVSELVEKYNAIIDACETDPSLKISMG